MNSRDYLINSSTVHLQTEQALLQELQSKNQALSEALHLAEIARVGYENHFLDFYDVAPFGFVALNGASEITECNITVAILLGVERKKLLLRSFTEWIAWENCDMWHRQFAQLINQHGQMSMELRMQRLDGGVFIAQADCLCLVNKFQLQSICIILTDITERKAKEQLFITSQQQYANIVDSAIDGIITYNSDQRILLFNAAAEKMFGCLAHEAIGDSLGRFLPDHSPLMQDTLVFEAGRIHLAGRRMDRDRCLTGFRANGHEFPLEMSISTLIVGGERMFTAFLRDISERRHVEKSLQVSQKENHFLADLIRTSSQPIAVVNLDGWLILVNTAYELLTGYTKAELQEFNFFVELTPATWRTLELENLQQLNLNQHSVRYEKESMRKNGTQVAIELLVHLKFNQHEQPEFYYVFVTDISSRKQAELATEDEQRHKDEFLAMLAHELRNPLAPILSATEIMKHEIANPERIAWCTAIIERQMTHLIRLVDDLLDISRINRGLVELKQDLISVQEVIYSAVETCQPLIELRRQDFSLHLPEEAFWLQGDKVRLAQVIANLLSNAIKYTEEGGQIQLVLEASESKISINISDNGCGIDAADLNCIFNLFYQVDHSLDRSQGGLGLGLSIAYSLVKRHQGQLYAFSAGRGLGSTFVIQLPRVLLVDANIRICKPDTPRLKAARRILVVDDNHDVADSLGFLLELDGHQVFIVYEAEAALSIASTVLPDVILLDIGLPGMDGYAVAKLLRQDSTLEKTLIIALTGYGKPDDKQKSLAAGFDAHLTKPINIDILTKLILSVCTV